MTMTKKHAKSVACKIKSMLKAAIRENEEAWFKHLGHVWTDTQGRQLFSDSYRSFRINKPLDLPEFMDDIEPLIQKETKQALKFRNIVESTFNTCERRERFQLSTPDIATLKTYTFILWDFGIGFPCANVRYLVDLLTIFPDAAFYTISPYKAIEAPIYAVSAYGDAILMPVKDDVKREEINAQSA